MGPINCNCGILGTGRIAAEFAQALAELSDARLVAVGSRAAESAPAFAGAHNVAHAYASYEALLADEDVEIVYVATPHPLHRPNTLPAWKPGKRCCARTRRRLASPGAGLACMAERVSHAQQQTGQRDHSHAHDHRAEHAATAPRH
jgi:hypothetical protein